MSKRVVTTKEFMEKARKGQKRSKVYVIKEGEQPQIDIQQDLLR